MTPDQARKLFEKYLEKQGSTFEKWQKQSKKQYKAGDWLEGQEVYNYIEKKGKEMDQKIIDRLKTRYYDEKQERFFHNALCGIKTLSEVCTCGLIDWMQPYWPSDYSEAVVNFIESTWPTADEDWNKHHLALKCCEDHLDKTKKENEEWLKSAEYKKGLAHLRDGTFLDYLDARNKEQ